MSIDEYGFIPPNSIECEQSVIGVFLSNREMMEYYITEINENDFYQNDHKIIFNAILKVHTQRKPVDVLSIVTEISKNQEIARIGGSVYLSDMSINNMGKINIKNHIAILKEKSHRRTVIEHAQKAIKDSIDENQDIQVIASTMSRTALEISSNVGDNKPEEIGIVAAEALGQIQKQKNSKSGLAGLSTGFETLDEMTSGFKKGDYILIAARPSMGKSTLAMNIADNMTRGNKNKALFFSLEMPKEDLIKRTLSSRTGVNLKEIMSGNFIFENSWGRLVNETIKMSEDGLYLYDKACTVAEIRNISTKLKETKGLDIIFIDYISYVKQTLKTENENQQISYISKEFKMIARELEIPVVVLVQLSRKVEGRHDKRPMLSDLRDSGSLEQDADIVAMLYRDSYYEKYDSKDPDINHTELSIKKQRNGETGTVLLDFMNHITMFVDIGKPRD